CLPSWPRAAGTRRGDLACEPGSGARPAALACQPRIARPRPYAVGTWRCGQCVGGDGRWSSRLRLRRWHGEGVGPEQRAGAAYAVGTWRWGQGVGVDGGWSSRLRLIRWHGETVGPEQRPGAA